MKRRQSIAMRQLRELHVAYDKHDYQPVGVTRWYGDQNHIWMCSCGDFRSEDRKGLPEPFTAATCGEFVTAAYGALNNKDKEKFKAFLKRIGWIADSKKAAQTIWGGKGKRHWLMTYGHYDTLEDFVDAKESRL